MMNMEVDSKGSKITVKITVESLYKRKENKRIRLTKWSIVEILKKDYGLNPGACLKEGRVDNKFKMLETSLEFINLDYKDKKPTPARRKDNTVKKSKKTLDKPDKHVIIKVQDKTLDKNEK